MSIHLQVGKKYVTRCGEYEVLVLSIHPDLTDLLRGEVVGVYLHSGHVDTWYLSGQHFSNTTTHQDLVAEYVEPPVPKLELGPEHVGRRVKLRNGTVTLVTSHNPDLGLYSIIANCGDGYTPDGYIDILNPGTDSEDIVEVLP